MPSITQILLYAPFRQAFVGQTVWLHNFRRSGFLIDWGDGTPVVQANAEYLTHVYTEPGQYTVDVGGAAIWGDDADNGIVASLSGGADYAYILLQSGAANLKHVFDITERITYSRTALNNEFLDLELPHTKVAVGSNEFAVVDNINAVLTELHENTAWLQDQTVIIDPTVNNTLVAWLSCGVENVWHTDTQGLSASFEDLGAPTSISDIVDIKCRKFGPESYLYIMENTQFRILNGSSYTAPTLVSSSAIGFNEPYVDLKAFDVDEFGNIFILDDDLVYRARYDGVSTNVQLLDRIGGVGDINDRYLFDTPTDLTVDNQSRLFIVDAGNSCVKVYSNSFVWLATLTSEHFDDDPPLKMCTDSLSGNIFVLTENLNLVVFDAALEFVQVNNLTTNANSVDLIEIVQTQTVHKIFADIQSNYLYVVTDNDTVKLTARGRLVSRIVSPSGAYFTDLRSGCVDDHNQLYIAKNDRIYQIVDPALAVYLARDYTGAIPLSAILMDDSGHEYVQDWVYNKSIKRLLLNLVLLNGAIQKRIVIAFDLDGSLRSFYVRSILSDEKYQLEIDLNNYVGVNEYVLSDVVNRILNNILNIQRGILNTLKPVASFVPTAFPYPVLPT